MPLTKQQRDSIKKAGRELFRLQEQLRQSEAERDALVSALRQIVHCDHDPNGCEDCVRIAESALKEAPTKNQQLTDKK